MKSKKITICLLTVLLFTIESIGAPALKRLYTTRQSDGTILSYYKNGDENCHYYSTQDGILIAPDNAGNFCYAKYNENGTAIATTTLAHEALQRNIKEISMVKQLAENNSTSLQTTIQHIKNIKKVGSQTNAQVSSIGSPNIPVILIQYSDKKFSMSDPNSFYDKHCNGINYKDEGGAGSVRDYFISQSDSLFQPHFDIIGPVTLDQPMAYYGQNSNEYNKDIHINQMITDAIDKAHAQGTNFSKYDEDKDGKLNIVYTIYAGFGENSYDDPNCVWPKQGSMSYTIDGVQVTAYACNNELVDYAKKDAQGNPVPTVDGIGVFCHEFSHCLGLPDFYNTNNADDIFGLSWWSLMDYGLYMNNSHTPIGYTAYERAFMKWMDVDTLSTRDDISLTPLATTHKAYKIINDNNPNEYYILENRQPSTWFPKAMGVGMLVFHVDYAPYYWNNNTVNNDKTHQRMTIIPADGSLVKENQNDTIIAGVKYDAVTAYDFRGDPYPSYTIKYKKDSSGTTIGLDTLRYNCNLTDSTFPADTVYQGKYMNKPLTDIKMDANGVVTFKFMGGSTTGIVGMKSDLQQIKNIDVYTMDGRCILRNTDYSTSKTKLRRGIYIIKSGKFVRKILIN
jgi:immune inhibitor A